jgi:hypothetical protein
MTHTDDLMAHPPAMAEMTGGLLEAETASAAGGVDSSGVVAAELNAEGHAGSGPAHAAPIVVAPGLAALEAETED